MINIAEIRCPHCGIEGKVVLPDSDTLVVGPCPECHKSVMIFAGKAVALNTDLMKNATREEAYRHLYDVLREFVRERLDRIFTSASSEKRESSPANESEDTGQEPEHEGNGLPSITREEMDEFLNKELPLVDNDDYFRTIFG